MKTGFPPPLPAGRPFDVVGFGGNAIDHLIVVPRHPRPGEKLRFARTALRGGGRTATAMVALARLGFRARYVGGVGDDAEGESSLALLRAEGIDVGSVLVRPGLRSQRAYILVNDATGERTVIWGRDERIALEPEEVRSETIVSARLFYTDAQNPRATVSAARHALDAAMPVVADIEDIRPGLDDLLPLLDYQIAPVAFASLVTGAANPEEGARRLEERTRGALIILTRGADGALARIEGRLESFPAYAVDVVDTTGAGDVFHAGFSAGCLLGLDLRESIDLANALAAMKCRGLGGRETLPRRMAEVDLFRRETPHRTVGPPGR